MFGWKTSCPSDLPLGESSFLELIAKDMLASPHAWGCGLKTFYIAHLAAAFGGVPTIEGVTMSDADVDFGENVIRDGESSGLNEAGFRADAAYLVCVFDRDN